MKSPASLRPRPKPPWLKTSIPGGAAYGRIKHDIAGNDLNTVCQEARCPNLAECWARGTATVMILGDTCTRACRFCAVKTGNPGGTLDGGEPHAVARAVKSWGLDYLVLTSVDRDDLPDKGAEHFARTIEATRSMLPDIRIEALVPDFQGDPASVDRVMRARVEVFAHNLETVEALQGALRDPRASYRRSLSVLAMARRLSPDTVTKSSLMLGMGETDRQLRAAMKDLLEAGVQVLTLGQYLQPDRVKHPVAEYVEPARFRAWRTEAMEMGFVAVSSGPMVRSSYKASQLFESVQAGSLE